MPHYFFHVKRGQMTILDQEGIELADTEEAEREAARRARIAELKRIPATLVLF